ncbi:MAG: energy transducer TonB [Bacteroidales bacterium]|jgi:protein TonB|nr:energy transducer TonB [Bacteroidales bacterium]
MAKDINIFSSSWRGLVFEGKNKQYGAYKLRENTSKRHLLAFAIILIFAFLVGSIPSLMTLLKFEGRDREETRVTELSALEEKPKEEEQQIDHSTPPPPELKTTIKFTPPVITEDSKVNDEDEMKTQEELTKSTAAISIKDVQGNDDGTGEDIRDVEEANLIANAVNDQVFEIVEQSPAFPGGEAKLLEWLQSELRYPPAAAERGVSGTVYVQFTVGKDGTIRDISVLRSPDPVFDREAIRVVQKMPKWLPGRQRGQAVAVRFRLPINFNLK